MGHVKPVERALVKPKEDVGVPVEDGLDRLVAHAIQLNRQRGPRPGHKVEDVDGAGQGAIAVQDVESIDVLRKETLGIRPVEWPARARAMSVFAIVRNQKNKSQEHTYGRPVVVNA